MEKNCEKTEGQSAAAETALKEPKMENLFELTMPHCEVPPPDESYFRTLEVTMPLGGTIMLGGDIPLNNQLNRLLTVFLGDSIEFLQEIIRKKPIRVDTADIDEMLGAPAPTGEELADIRTKDKAYNDAKAETLRNRQEWAKPRLEECQGALAKIMARPIRF